MILKTDGRLPVGKNKKRTIPIQITLSLLTGPFISSPPSTCPGCITSKFLLRKIQTHNQAKLDGNHSMKKHTNRQPCTPIHDNFAQNLRPNSSSLLTMTLALKSRVHQRQVLTRTKVQLC
ncbi:hypothetical protein GOP47_0004508 [Adiantum capillus-veneris]|uniref:Uncharacterized protein n=1 Tax=Adiantum capillus-veneris TaxID=13818 RepID=A0A9D4ZQE4_ADICA|nr:hypothetical protein GOP47_0004508 [Adiantum capillus-veneris]